MKKIHIDGDNKCMVCKIGFNLAIELYEHHIEKHDSSLHWKTVQPTGKNLKLRLE